MGRGDNCSKKQSKTDCFFKSLHAKGFLEDVASSIHAVTGKLAVLSEDFYFLGSRGQEQIGSQATTFTNAICFGKNFLMQIQWEDKKGKLNPSLPILTVRSPVCLGVSGSPSTGVSSPCYKAGDGADSYVEVISCHSIPNSVPCSCLAPI